MEENELKKILENHKTWLLGDGGERADRAYLWGSDLMGANLRGSNLERADLWGANLERADLWGANLRGANLRGADLRGANLWGANLERANLERANLRGSNLERADLWEAYLWGSDLMGANLRGSNLERADLGGDKHIYQVSGFGSERRMTTYWVEEDKIWCGCFVGTLDEFAAKIEETHADNPEYLEGYRAVVALFRTMTALIEKK